VVLTALAVIVVILLITAIYFWLKWKSGYEALLKEVWILNISFFFFQSNISIVPYMDFSA
jgi:hypothetical protein